MQLDFRLLESSCLDLHYQHQSTSRGYSAPPTARQQASTGSPFEWTARNFNNRGAYARRPASNEFGW